MKAEIPGGGGIGRLFLTVHCCSCSVETCSTPGCRQRGTGGDGDPVRWVKGKTIPNGTWLLLLCSDLLNAGFSPERYW